jgi:hypothetical protein
MTSNKICTMSKPTQRTFGWGGKRAGAGRKPAQPKEPRRRYTAEDILGAINEINEWKPLLQSENEKIKLTALIYLTDRRDGKARQPITGSDGGATQHEQFDLSRLSTEQLDQLEGLIESAAVEAADADQREEAER